MQSIRQQIPLLAAVLCAVLVFWLALLWLIMDSCHPIVMMTMPMSPAWSAINLIAVFSMWVVMMAAMMLPSAIPMILLHNKMSSKSGITFESLAFILSYLLIWALFSIAAVAFQFFTHSGGILNASSLTTSKIVSIILLLLAGAYQFSELKNTCLNKCRTPVGFFMGFWKSGVNGAFNMGLRHGLFCLGCCWAIMLLLFVGGVMNLTWVLLLTIAVVAEKTLPAGELISKVIGVALILSAVYMGYSLVNFQSMPPMQSMTMSCMQSMKM
jgi:predicted metal-binding membrane protein